MQIRIYFCAVLYNEDSEIIQVSDVKRQATENGVTDVISQVQNSKTTLSALYKDGWRLAHVIPSHETNGYRLFLEKDWFFHLFKTGSESVCQSALWLSPQVPSLLQS